MFQLDRSFVSERNHSLLSSLIPTQSSTTSSVNYRGSSKTYEKRPAGIYVRTGNDSEPSVALSIRKVEPVLQKSQNLVPQNTTSEKASQFHYRKVQPIHQKSHYPATHNTVGGGPTLESSDVRADVRNAGNEDWWNWIETEHPLNGNIDLSDRTDQEQADNVNQEASPHKTLTVPEGQFSCARSDSSQLSLNLPGPSYTTCDSGNIPDRVTLERTCRSKKSLTDAACPCDPDQKCVCVPDLDPADLTDEDPDFQCNGKSLNNSVGSDSESPKKKKKKCKKSVKPKDNKALPPRNPHNLNFRDEFGNSIPVGTADFKNWIASMLEL